MTVLRDSNNATGMRQPTERDNIVTDRNDAIDCGSATEWESCYRKSLWAVVVGELLWEIVVGELHKCVVECDRS